MGLFAALLVLLVGGGALVLTRSDALVDMIRGSGSPANTANDGEDNPSSQGAPPPTSEGETTDTEGLPEEQEPNAVEVFVSDYYGFVVEEDWEGTYSLLDESTQGACSEEVWVEAMQSVTSRGGKRDFGLGWFRSSETSRQGATFVEHLGGGAGFWNVMRLYPEQSLGVVMMGNTTRYDHEAILDAISHLDWSESTPADKGT